MRNALFAVLIGVIAFGALAAPAMAQLPPYYIPTAYEGTIVEGSCAGDDVTTTIYVTYDPTACDGHGSMKFSVNVYYWDCAGEESGWAGVSIGPVCPTVTPVFIPGIGVRDYRVWSGSGVDPETNLDISLEFHHGYGAPSGIAVEGSGFYESNGNYWVGSGVASR